MSRNGLKFFNIAFFIITCVFLLLPIYIVFAEEGYKVLAPLPGTVDTTTGRTTLEKYLPGLFNLAVGVSAAFVLLSFVIGGFQYMSTDAFMKKEEGKKRITNAIYGLLLVAGAYTILYTINPKLTDINLLIESITTAPAGGQLYGPADARCQNCELIIIPIKSGQGSTVAPDTNQRLTAMHDALPSGTMRVTEAFPPTTTHRNECHYRGTCVDYNFLPQITPTPAQINSVLTTAANNGLRGQYEVSTDTEKTTLINAGVPANRITQVDGIVAHFSIYNCNIDAASCANLPP